MPQPKPVESARRSDVRWLLLFHRLPAKPDYLRVKVGRRLRRLGAVALKNTVYVLPALDQVREELASLAREALERGGEAIVCDARFVAGLSDQAIEDRFREARDAEYGTIAAEARQVIGGLRSRRSPSQTQRRSIGRRLE